jgi:hypothetical protein
MGNGHEASPARGGRSSCAAVAIWGAGTAAHEACCVTCVQEGYEAFERAYPFLVTTSVKSNIYKTYPSQVRTHPQGHRQQMLWRWGLR